MSDTIQLPTSVTPVLTARIQEITSCLRLYDQGFEGFGVGTGTLGVSLFHLYHYLFVADEQSLALAQQQLEEIFEQLNAGNLSDSAMFDLLELGRYLIVLFDKLPMGDDINEYLSHIDELAYEFMLQQLEAGSLDTEIGALLAGSYFIKRLTSLPAARATLETLVAGIERLAYDDLRGGIYWYGAIRGKDEIELGLIHGQAGIISCLCDLYRLGICQETCRQLIVRAITFMAAYETTERSLTPGTFYPLIANKPRKTNGFNICYGDTGVAFAWLKAGDTLGEPLWRTKGLEIFSWYATHRTSLRAFVKDANLIYGTSGLSILYVYLGQLTGDRLYFTAADYWMRETCAIASQPPEFAGYTPYLNANKLSTYACFAEGIAGIGIAMMAYTNYSLLDFMHFLGYDHIFQPHY